MVEMERLLIWLEDQKQRRIPVSLMVILEKAERIFEALKSKKVEVNSLWWVKVGLAGLKFYANLHNLKVQGEAASADEETFPSGVGWNN